MARRYAALLVAVIASAGSAEPFLAKQESITQQPANVAAAVPGIFEFNCESSDDFGYPRFNSLDELKASAWSEYFLKIYGELPPADGYPVCVFDFWHIQNMSSPSFTKLGLKQPDPNKAGGKLHGWQIPTFLANILSQYYPGIAYRYTKGEYVNGDLFSAEVSTGRSYTLYREWYLYHQIPDNGWVEVMHMAGPFFKRETEAMWFSRSRGSGVYFNVGKTIAFNTHQDGYNQFLVDKSGPCKLPKPELNSTDPMAQGAVFENALSMCLRSRGYDSFQFRPYPYPVLNTFGQAGWSELASTRLAGRFACGAEKGGVSAFFRSGWRASKQCDCDDSQLSLNCNPSSDSVVQIPKEVPASQDSIIE